jgi:hypothetical protein
VAGEGKLTSHLDLVPRSKKRGSIDPLPIHLHVVVLYQLSTKKTLPLSYQALETRGKGRMNRLTLHALYHEDRELVAH